MLRHLRYLPAGVFALLAVGFVALWVRSLHSEDSLWVSSSSMRGLRMMSELGRLSVTLFYERVMFDPWPTWSMVSFPHTADDIELHRHADNLGFDYRRDRFYLALTIPHWFLVASSLGLAALLALKPITRFTVRGLLITTTLLAAVLGLVVYAL